MLGPNGTGKTSLLRILLGLLEPSAGRVRVNGRPPREGRERIGYVPQQRAFDRDLVLRARDLVRLGLDGHRWGFGRLSSEERGRIERVLAEVGAGEYTDAPIGRLSGGEQQRLRIAQALVANPALILADEPLLSLDLAYQQVITGLLDERRRNAGTPIVFVTHDINPVLEMVDRVLYLAPGSWAIGAPDEVLTSETLSELYGIDGPRLRRSHSRSQTARPARRNRRRLGRRVRPHPRLRKRRRPRPQSLRLHHVHGRRRLQGRHLPTARPTNSASTPSRTASPSTTCTPRSCTCWASTTNGSPTATPAAISA